MGGVHGSGVYVVRGGMHGQGGICGMCGRGGVHG